MGRVRKSLSAAVAALLLGPGCAQFKTDKDTQAGLKFPDGLPTAPLSRMVQRDSGEIVQASATTPAVPAPSLVPGFLQTANEPQKLPVAEMGVMWRNHIDYLPDPTRHGALGPGLAGQLFLYGPGLQVVKPGGKLIVALYDETPRPPGQPAKVPECWEIAKEDLAKLQTVDEVFGPGYAIFLPWPTYTPDVTNIRMAYRYEPDPGTPNAFTIYGRDQKIALSAQPTGQSNLQWEQKRWVPGAAEGNGPFPQPGMPAPPRPADDGYAPMPIGGPPRFRDR